MILQIDVPYETEILSATILVRTGSNNLVVGSRVFTVLRGELKDEFGSNKIEIRKNQEEKQ